MKLRSLKFKSVKSTNDVAQKLIQKKKINKKNWEIRVKKVEYF